MGELKTKGKKRVFCFTIGMIAGIIIGTSIFSILVSYRLDKSYERIATLENEINEKDTRLEKLEESTNTMDIILEEVQVFIEYGEEEDKGKDKDEIDEIIIKEAIHEKYQSLIGKEIKTIDVDIVLEVIDRRIFKLSNKEYRLKVNKLVLTEELRIWVEVGLM